MTRFKIIHNTANENIVQDGLTPIDKIFCGEFNEDPKFFEIVYDRESYPYPELMETVYEKIRDYLKPNYVFSIYEFSIGKNIKGFKIYVDAKTKDGHMFDENDLKSFITYVSGLSSRYNIVGEFCVEECYVHAYGWLGFSYQNI